MKPNRRTQRRPMTMLSMGFFALGLSARAMVEDVATRRAPSPPEVPSGVGTTTPVPGGFTSGLERHATEVRDTCDARCQYICMVAPGLAVALGYNCGADPE